jgi:predicted nucleic acid-binding protein
VTVFVLDTNVLFDKNFIESMSRDCQRNGHRLMASALVLAERSFQLRRKLQGHYDQSVFDIFIETHGIEIVPFDRDAATRVAEHLCAEFPSHDDWQLAKWRRCAAAVGHTGAPPRRPRCPATVDWLIARHTAGTDVVLVTGDRGAEFGSICNVGTEEALRMVSVEAAIQ